MPNDWVVYGVQRRQRPALSMMRIPALRVLRPTDRVPQDHDAHVVRAEVARVHLAGRDAELLAEFLVLECPDHVDLEEGRVLRCPELRG